MRARHAYPRPRCIALAALLAACLAGCATRAPDPSTYLALGGAAGIEGIVDDLLEVIVEDDRINLQFADADIVRLRRLLIEQFCAESGGPCVYSGLSMREAHAGRGIDDAQFNALVEGLVAVMEARGIPLRAQNRLLRRLAPMHRDIVGD